MIVFDSYAWLEYFSGSKKGIFVKKIIESQEEILTPSICIAEIKRKYLRENKEYKSRIDFIIRRSKIMQINLKICLVAASISHKKKLYLIDSLVYACALSVNSELLTGDKHFRNFENIQFLT